MSPFASFFKMLSSADEHAQPIPVNPSEVLHINRDEYDGMIELRSLDEEEYNPSNVLRISWIKRDDVKGVMKTVWVTDEAVVY